MKPTYEELLDTLFDVTQALHNTLVQDGRMSSADKDQRWTITHDGGDQLAADKHQTGGNGPRLASCSRKTVFANA